MTETAQDAYVKGYNQGRKDEAAHVNGDDALFKTPDVTPAQLVALVGAALAVAASFGFDLSSDQRDSVLQLVTVLASVLLVGDAAIRHGRATGSAKKDG